MSGLETNHKYQPGMELRSRRRSRFDAISGGLQEVLNTNQPRVLVICMALLSLVALAMLGSQTLASLADFPAMTSYTAADTVADRLLRKLIATVLVYFMQLGFIAFEAGAVRQNYRRQSAVKNLIVFAVSFISYMILGWRLQRSLNPSAMTDLLDVAFNAGFASTVALIVANTITERSTILINAWCSVVASGVAYPLLAGLAFSGGWLATLGFVDTAGGCVVHLLGGMLGLTAALWVGPRSKRRAWVFLGRPQMIEQRDNVPWTVICAFFLWFGWLGFNSGSARNWADFLRALTNTNIGACAGGFVGLIIALANAGNRKKAGKNLPAGGALREITNLERVVVGMMGGLVAVTANSNLVAPWQALVEALIGSFVAMFGSVLMEQYLQHLDDPLGAFATHGLAGIVGVLSSGLFLSKATSVVEILNKVGIQLLGCLIAGGLGLILASIPCLFLWILDRQGMERLYGKRLSLTAYEQQTGRTGTEIGLPAEEIARAWARLSVGLGESVPSGDQSWIAAVSVLALSDESDAAIDRLFDVLDSVLDYRWLGSPEEQAALAAIGGRAHLASFSKCVERALIHRNPDLLPGQCVRKWNALEDSYKEALIVTIFELAESFSLQSDELRQTFAISDIENMQSAFLKAKRLFKDISEEREPGVEPNVVVQRAWQASERLKRLEEDSPTVPIVRMEISGHG